MNKKLIIFLPLLLGGCETIYNWADGVGKHMPTIGEPCRHWQCVTESGQRESDQTKWLENATNKPAPPKKDQQQQTPGQQTPQQAAPQTETQPVK